MASKSSHTPVEWEFVPIGCLNSFDVCRIETTERFPPEREYPVAQGIIVQGVNSILTAKEETRRLLDAVPDGATWEDIQHSIYVRERIERGRLEAKEEKLVDQDEIEVRMQRWLAE